MQNPDADKKQRRRIQQDIIDIVSFKVVLEELRKGDIPKATELCEMVIDYTASRIWHELKTYNGDKSVALGCLRDIKRIRQQWPREVLVRAYNLGPEAVDVEAVGDERATSVDIQEVADEVRKIFDELEKQERG